MAKKLITVVTGSNRGIGKAIIESLAAKKHNPPLAIYATSRSGQALDISPQHDNEVHYAQLDISDSNSISKFLKEGKFREIPVDVLINNAGLNLDYNEDGSDAASRAKETLRINYEGTKNTCMAFLDAKGGGMSANSGARIVNVSSAAASLHGYSTELQDRFRSVQSLSDVDALAEDYLEALSDSTSTAKSQGWNMPSYSVSKALINALTIVLAQSVSSSNNTLINCCDPGWVASDMGNLVGNAPKSEEEGARIPIKLAFGDIGNATGKFWGNPNVSSGADGKVLNW